MYRLAAWRLGLTGQWRSMLFSISSPLFIALFSSFHPSLGIKTSTRERGFTLKKRKGIYSQEAEGDVKTKKNERGGYPLPLFTFPHHPFAIHLV